MAPFVFGFNSFRVDMLIWVLGPYGLFCGVRFGGLGDLLEPCSSVEFRTIWGHVKRALVVFYCLLGAVSVSFAGLSDLFNIYT